MNSQHAIRGKKDATGQENEQTRRGQDRQAQGPHPQSAPPLAPTFWPNIPFMSDGDGCRGKGTMGGDAGALRLPYVEIKNLKKNYGLKPVLRRIDLELCDGERLALLGANGAGKTTLLRILAGLTKPDAGTVTIAGLDVVQDVQQIRRLVGFVAHQPYLYEELTVLENLLFFGRMYTVEHARERARELLQRVGLEKRVQERVSTLSRGQIQRLAWARALLHAPRLLLLDEPDTGLDQAGNELIDALLLEHNAQGGSIVFTTHHLERALQCSDRVVVLGKRRIAYQQATTALELAELQCVCREVAQ